LTKKIRLEPGEPMTLKFTINRKDVSFVNSSFKTVFEPGRFDIIVGAEKKEYLWE